jgi:hypothetical protein
MKASSTRLRGFLVLLAVAMIVSVTTETTAQERQKFALKGTTELGGSISFQSITAVSDGNTGNAVTVFALAPFIGYFVTDGFELGLNPLGITSISYSGSSSTQVTIFLAPSYNFKTESIAYPFIEALIGYASQSNGTTLSGFCWGGRAGAKLAVTDKGLLILGLEYVQLTLNPSGAPNRNGSNQLAISAGFTVWF